MSKSNIWYDDVEYALFDDEHGVFTSRFLLKDGNVLVWTGDDAYLSKINWDYYLETGELSNESLPFKVPIPPEILQKISQHRPKLTS